MKSISSGSARFSFAAWVNEHKKLSISLVATFVILGAGAVAAGFLYPAPKVNADGQVIPPKAEKAVVDAPKKFYSPLTGVEVADEASTKQQVRAIMIENSPDARPQSGLKEAGVVYEAIAEGGITRFLTLHQEDRPGIIGPVRSLRPYYIDWLAPFDATVSHVGGSYLALQEVRNGKYKDIDQFFNGAYYWRATDRYAPHNVYTNSAKLDELNQKKGYTSSNFTAWPRKLDSPLVADVTKIDIPISSPTYSVHYDYDAATNSYVRKFATGQAHTDRELGQITPKVVIAMKVPTQIGFEDGYREQMQTYGLGEAYIFQDGTMHKVFWRKPGQKDQISFYDSFGRPVALNIGQTWISVTATDKAVTWQ